MLPDSNSPADVLCECPIINQLVDSRIWRRPLLYLTLSVAASTLFVLPLNWEGKVAGRNVSRTDHLGNDVQVCKGIIPYDLRVYRDGPKSGTEVG